MQADWRQHAGKARDWLEDDCTSCLLCIAEARLLLLPRPKALLLLLLGPLAIAQPEERGGCAAAAAEPLAGRRGGLMSMMGRPASRTGNGLGGDLGRGGGVSGSMRCWYSVSLRMLCM